MNQNEYISDSVVKNQKWKFILVAVLWPAFLFGLPAAWSFIGAWAILLVIFPGLYLFTWCGYLMHESWHKYVPGLPYGIFYNLFAIMLFTDPQVYGLIHGFHHSQVNTYDDTEFHPVGRIKNRFLRAVYNWLEIIFGIAFLEILAIIVVPIHPVHRKRYRWWKPLVAFVGIGGFLVGVGALSAFAFKLDAAQVAVPFLVMFWAGSFFLHHSQMVEHGNLIASGDWDRRNMLTRNLAAKGIVARLFLFMTHQDSREHVLHHTLVRVYSRPFPGRVPMPEQAVYLTMRGYMGVLGDLLIGREKTV
jgi:hypothetical protein